MAHSTKQGQPTAGAERGFVPARDEEERFLMRHVEDMVRAADAKGIARYSSFLSDREQNLAEAALHRCGWKEYRFDGGYQDAERRLLCVEPEGCWGESPLCCVRIDCIRMDSQVGSGESVPEHRDYLGSLVGLAVGREALGDIVLPSNTVGTAYLFALRTAAAVVCEELRQVGRWSVRCTMQSLETLPEFPHTERTLVTATVSSLRLDAVMAAMLHCSRGMAEELISAGRVEINHLPMSSAHAAVYAGDVLTVRGKGRFRLTALLGKSKKERFIIEFFRY